MSGLCCTFAYRLHPSWPGMSRPSTLLPASARRHAWHKARHSRPKGRRACRTHMTPGVGTASQHRSCACNEHELDPSDPVKKCQAGISDVRQLICRAWRLPPVRLHPSARARGMARQVTNAICSLSARVHSRQWRCGNLSTSSRRSSPRQSGLYCRHSRLRHRAGFSLAVPTETDLRQPSFWRAALLATRRDPGPPGCVLARHARGRRIPAPPSDASR